MTTRAEQLMRVMTRGVGHTKAAIDGVANTKAAVIVTATEEEADRLRREFDVDAVSLLNAERVLLGHDKPVVIDSYTVTALASEARELTDQLDEEKKERNANAVAMGQAVTRADKVEAQLAIAMEALEKTLEMGHAPSERGGVSCDECCDFCILWDGTMAMINRIHEIDVPPQSDTKAVDSPIWTTPAPTGPGAFAHLKVPDNLDEMAAEISAKVAAEDEAQSDLMKRLSPYMAEGDSDEERIANGFIAAHKRLRCTLWNSFWMILGTVGFMTWAKDEIESRNSKTYQTLAEALPWAQIMDSLTALRGKISGDHNQDKVLMAVDQTMAIVNRWKPGSKKKDQTDPDGA